jgi:hypothetical protein
MKIRKWVIGAGLVLLAAQILQPEKNNPPVDTAEEFNTIYNPPAELTSVLKNCCYDCHSNETKYPWYAYFSPVSWYLNNHIREGREELNFSVWGTYQEEDLFKILEHVAEEVKEHKMPLSSYTWLHPEAKLTDTQREMIVRWFAAKAG